MAQTELQRLGGEFEITLQEIDLGHEKVSISEGRLLIQTVLQTALGRLYVT